MYQTVCFTGHRPNALGGYDPNNELNRWIRSQLAEAVRWAEERGARRFISGMALGVDQWAFEVVHNLGHYLIAAIPCDGQERMWPDASKARYKILNSLADEVHNVSPGPYAGWKMQKRNEWMVDRADLVIAVWNGSPTGGTANCVRYAQFQKKPIYRIDPGARVSRPPSSPVSSP